MTTGHATVLVVDDDADTRETLGFIIRREGHNAVCLRNGHEALDYLRKSPAPDLVLLDLMMPIMNGWEFLHERRHDPRISRVPVVVLSAVADQDVFEGPKDVDSVLQKPPSLHTVLELVDDYCERQ
jgi:two-component system, chemotaxis family, chemotaxis protein CheY